MSTAPAGPAQGQIKPAPMHMEKKDARIIKVDPGTNYVTKNPSELLVTVLGSCVAACLRDPLAGIGGMNHFMLPSSQGGEWGGVPASLRYGNFAMEKLINDILRGGGQRRRLEAKIFGGAAIMDHSGVGARNVQFVETHLREEGIEIVKQHVGGRHALQVQYAPVAGKAFLRSLPVEDNAIARNETRFASGLNGESLCGSVELFS